MTVRKTASLDRLSMKASSLVISVVIICTSVAACTPDQDSVETFQTAFPSDATDRWEVVLGGPWAANNGEFAPTADPNTYRRGMVVCDFPMTDGEVETVLDQTKAQAHRLRHRINQDANKPSKGSN